MLNPSPSTTFTFEQLQVLEHHISNIFSNDALKVNESNLILTQLKQQDSLIFNIQFILENAKLDKTKFYVLVAFEQRLPLMWESLPRDYKARVRQYFANMFLKFAKAKQQERAIGNTVTSIMVKAFIYGFDEWTSFVDDMLAEARKDQMVCDAVMTALNILADQATEFRSNNTRANFLMFLQSKYENIIMLSLMVIEASRTNKMKVHLMKSTLEMLEKYLNLIPPGTLLPLQTQQSLLQLLLKNTFRENVVRLLTTIITNTFSIDFYTSVVNAIGTFLPTYVDLATERIKIQQNSKKDLEPFDLFMRGLAGMFHQIIVKVQQNAQNAQIPPKMLKTCYEYTLALSQLVDEDTWLSCLQAWVIYYKHNLQLDIQLERLVAPLVRKAIMPPQLRSSTTEIEQTAQTSFVIAQTAKKYLALFEQTIFQSIQKHIYIRFNEELFSGACYCLCYLSQFYSPSDKQKLTNFLKLLLNVNESISAQNRIIVVVQTLNIVSFYPWILNNNQFLSDVLELKYIENIPSSLDALAFLAQRYTLSEKTIKELEEKTFAVQRDTGAVETTIKRIWMIVLAAEKNTTDVRETKLQIDKEQILSYVLRNYAGLEVYGLAWQINWEAIKLVLHKNLEIMKQIVQVEGEHSLKFAKNSSHLKAHNCLIKLCCLYCKLCQQSGLSPKSNPQFLSLVQDITANSSMHQLSQLVQLCQ